MARPRRWGARGTGAGTAAAVVIKQSTATTTVGLAGGTGALNLTAGAALDVKTNLSAVGGMTLEGTALNLTGTQFISNGGVMSFTGPVALSGGATTFDTTAGPTANGANVTFFGAGSTVNGGAASLTLKGGLTGTVDFQGAISNATAFSGTH